MRVDFDMLGVAAVSAMTTPSSWIAEVSPSFQRDGIRWLVLECSPGTGGWFLFGLESRDAPSQFDNWYEDADMARMQALEDWGISVDGWRERPPG